MTPFLRSRGEIIPALLSCGTVSEATALALGLDAREFPPFRLVALEAGRIVVLRGDGLQVLAQVVRSTADPFMATSSSLGDHIVEWPRRELFYEIFEKEIDPFDAQEAFHRHSWADRRHISVEMSRMDARTVSRTAIEVFRDSVRMTYRSLGVSSVVQSSAAYPRSAFASTLRTSFDSQHREALA